MVQLIVSIIIFGTFWDAGGTFLTIPRGAQMVAMGNTGVARWEDPSSLYLNPAAPALKRGCSFTTLNTTTFGPGEVIINSLLSNFSVPREPTFLESDFHNRYWESGFFINSNLPFIKRMVFRLSGIRNTWGTIEARKPDGTYLGTFTPYDRATSFNASFLLPHGIGIGYTFKDIYSFLAPDSIMRLVGRSGGSARTVTHDIGILIDPHIGFALGIAIHNYSGHLKYTSNGEALPLPEYIRYGFALKLHDLVGAIAGWDVRRILSFTFSSDWITDRVGKEHETWTGYGVEIGVGGVFYFRKGHFKDETGSRIGNTEGWAIKFGAIGLDVADDGKIYGSLLNHNYWVSLSIETPSEKGLMDDLIGKDRMATIQALLFPGAGHIYLGDSRGIFYSGLSSSLYSLYRRKSNRTYLLLSYVTYVASLVDFYLWRYKKWRPLSSIF